MKETLIKSSPQGDRDTVSVGGKIATITRHDKRSKGKLYPSYRVRYWQDGKRKEITAPSMEEAKSRAKEALKHHESGAGFVMKYNPAQAANIEAALGKLQKVGVPLLDAVTQFCAAHTALGSEGKIADAVHYYLADKERRALKPINVPKLIEQFLDEKKVEGMSSEYQRDIKQRLEKFGKTFKCPIASVQTVEIADWLKSIGAKGRNGNNYRNAICTLFSYARERGYLPREKKTEAELLSRFKEQNEEIGIYTPKQIRRMLDAASSDAMRTSIAIGAFAGLRSMEIFRLEWSDINLEAGHIAVAAHKAKTAQRRIVPILPNLRAWLELVENKKGRVSPPLQKPTNFSRNITAACEAAGVAMKPNGLRHSFASYRLADVQSADKVALEMGNSPRKLFQHYRELVTASAASAWFNVTPSTPLEEDQETPENVVPIAKGKAA